MGIFDAIIVFCQVGSMIEHLDRTSFENNMPRVWDLSILFGCVPVQNYLAQKLPTNPLPFNSIYVYGKKDEVLMKKDIPKLYEKYKQQIYVHQLSHVIVAVLLLKKRSQTSLTTEF